MTAETRYARSGDVHIAYQVVGDRAWRDLVAGSHVAFAERGAHELKGVPGPWTLYAVEGAGEGS